MKSVETLFKDSSKFKSISVAPDKYLNHIINSEKRVTDLLKKLRNKNAISEETYNELSPVGSKPETHYGPVKVYKPVKNELPPFRPILSAVTTPKFKQAKFLLPILSDITLNEFNVKDSFLFFDEILTQHNDLHMVYALFTNIPLEQTIDIWVEKLFETQDTLVKRISKKDICDLPNLATKQSFVTFNNKFYMKIDSVTFCRIYIDHIFVLYESSKSANSFHEYISSKHERINFTVEQNNVGSNSF